MSKRTLNVSGLSETEKLIAFVNQNGLKEAAVKYGTNTSSLSRWIRSQGYSLRRVYLLTDAGKNALHFSEVTTT